MPCPLDVFFDEKEPSESKFIFSSVGVFTATCLPPIFLAPEKLPIGFALLGKSLTFTQPCCSSCGSISPAILTLSFFFSGRFSFIPKLSEFKRVLSDGSRFLFCSLISECLESLFGSLISLLIALLATPLTSESFSR